MKSVARCRDELVEYYDEQVCVGSRKDGNVDGHFAHVGFVESDAKISFATEK